MKQKSKEIILRAMEQYRGDDYERATHAFRGMSDAQLDSKYGASGKTCRQILDGYRQQREEEDEALREFKELTQ